MHFPLQILLFHVALWATGERPGDEDTPSPEATPVAHMHLVSGTRSLMNITGEGSELFRGMAEQVATANAGEQSANKDWQRLHRETVQAHAKDISELDTVNGTSKMLEREVIKLRQKTSGLVGSEMNSAPPSENFIMDWGDMLPYFGTKGCQKGVGCPLGAMFEIQFPRGTGYLAKALLKAVESYKNEDDFLVHMLEDILAKQGITFASFAFSAIQGGRLAAFVTIHPGGDEKTLKAFFQKKGSEVTHTIWQKLLCGQKCPDQYLETCMHDYNAAKIVEGHNKFASGISSISNDNVEAFLKVKEFRQWGYSKDEIQQKSFQRLNARDQTLDCKQMANFRTAAKTVDSQQTCVDMEHTEHMAERSRDCSRASAIQHLINEGKFWEVPIEEQYLDGIKQKRLYEILTEETGGAVIDVMIAKVAENDIDISLLIDIPKLLADVTNKALGVEIRRILAAAKKMGLKAVQSHKVLTAAYDTITTKVKQGIADRGIIAKTQPWGVRAQQEELCRLSLIDSCAKACPKSCAEACAKSVQESGESTESCLKACESWSPEACAKKGACTCTKAFESWSPEACAKSVQEYCAEAMNRLYGKCPTSCEYTVWGKYGIPEKKQKPCTHSFTYEDKVDREKCWKHRIKEFQKSPPLSGKANETKEKIMYKPKDAAWAYIEGASLGSVNHNVVGIKFRLSVVGLSEKFMSTTEPHQVVNIRNEVAKTIQEKLKEKWLTAHFKLCGWKPCQSGTATCKPCQSDPSDTATCRAWMPSCPECAFNFLPNHDFRKVPRNSTFMTRSMEHTCQNCVEFPHADDVPCQQIPSSK